MTIAQTPEILQTVNNAISNVMQLITTYGTIIFWISIVFFFLWLVFEIARVMRELPNSNM